MYDQRTEHRAVDKNRRKKTWKTRRNAEEDRHLYDQSAADSLREWLHEMIRLAAVDHAHARLVGVSNNLHLSIERGRAAS